MYHARTGLPSNVAKGPLNIRLEVELPTRSKKVEHFSANPEPHASNMHVYPSGSPPTVLNMLVCCVHWLARTT